jgi:FHA domain
MPYSNSSKVSDCSISFLEQNPCLSGSLFADCNFNLYEVATMIEPVLQAEKRCRITPCYIQAVTTGRTAFLASNLTIDRKLQATAIASNWLLGRSPACAISILNPSVSRRHAVIGYRSGGGFYITDLNSSNGTWVNGRRLAPMQPKFLEDSDLLLIGTLRVEFFVAGSDRFVPDQSDATCY